MRKFSLMLFCLALGLINSRGALGADFNKMECSQSRLVIPGLPDLQCWRGPDWKGLYGCVAENLLASSSTGNFTVQLTANRTWKGCLIKTSSDNLDYEIKSYFSWTANATDWGNYREISGATGANMRNQGDNCFDFYKTGPKQYVGDDRGFAWVVHGVFCSPGGQPLDDQKVASFINSMVVKE